jgi:hypothetical protein
VKKQQKLKHSKYNAPDCQNQPTLFEYMPLLKKHMKQYALLLLPRKKKPAQGFLLV